MEVENGILIFIKKVSVQELK